MSYLRRFVWCLAFLFPSVVLGQTNYTTLTFCTAYAKTDGEDLTVLEDYFGPATVQVGDRGYCTLQPPSSTCGSGTISDPYDPACGNPLGIASYTEPGTPFDVEAGNNAINVVTISLVATPSAQGSTPVPLGPWVPLGSGLGIALLALLWWSRAGKV